MSRPRVLKVDIETFPDVVYTWGVYEANAIKVVKHWYMLSFAAQWDNGKPFVRTLQDYRGYKPGGTDRLLAKELHGLLNEADIVVAHNGAQFDLKKINTRMLVHGLTPPSPYTIVDTKREAKGVFGFSSNKLDWLCQQLEIGHKLEHEGFPLWEACAQGNPKAWAKMARYNLHDVRLLNELHRMLSPWIRQPNLGAYGAEAVCPNPVCGSQDLQQRGLLRTKTRTYQRFQCQKCGTWARSTKSEAGGAVLTR